MMLAEVAKWLRGLFPDLRSYFEQASANLYNSAQRRNITLKEVDQTFCRRIWAIFEELQFGKSKRL